MPLIVIESNSRQFPTECYEKRRDIVVTVKWPTANTDYVAARHISFNTGEYPFFCYKWNPPLGGGKFDHIPRNNIIQADWEYWDDWFQLFDPKNEPSSGCCAVFSVVEYFKPETIGLMGFDYVLDNNTDWIHDARAERESIEQLADIIDLRDRRENNRRMKWQ